MSTTAAFLARLQDQARAAEAAETGYRAEVAQRSAELAQARAEAYRRVNFLAQVSSALAEAPAEAQAQALAAGVLRERFGWHEDTPARTEVLERFAPVAAALWAGGQEDVPTDVPADAAAALDAFESWYAETRQSSFWYLFEHYMPETPRVDF